MRQIGYSCKTWAREVYAITNDIDQEELRKPSVHADMPVHADARDLLEQLNRALNVLLAEEGSALSRSPSRPSEKQVFDDGEGLRFTNWN